jgi:acyl-CoA reductase-like NAD-dependent aldehyde dehydrogenase
LVKEDQMTSTPTGELGTAAPAPYSGFDSLYVGGTWRAGGTGRYGDDLDPWSGGRVARIALASTADVREALESARDAQKAWANDASVGNEPHLPFGGEKNSGLGRFGSQWILEEFTTVHWISVQRTPRHYLG